MNIVPSGEYTLRIELLPRILAGQAKNGEEPGTWPNQGKRYSAKNERLTTGQQLQQGVNQSTGLRVLRIRGVNIPVQAEDQVKIVGSGERYSVTSAPARDYDTQDTIITIQLVTQQ